MEILEYKIGQIVIILLYCGYLKPQVKQGDGFMIDQTCDECNGRRFTTKLDLALAKTVKKPCPKCKGTGHIPADAITDGTVFFTQQCMVGFWQELQGGQPISTLTVYICPVISKHGAPQHVLKKDPNNPLAKPVLIPRIFLQIANMHTKVKHRGKGYMSKLLEKAIQDPKIEWVETDWEDSTGDGRNFLIGKGFNQVKGKLVKMMKDYNAGSNDNTDTGSSEQAPS